ncbi:MAG: PLP-dependent cysteine synthase family protein [Haloferacaceae archaeon]
MPSPVDESTIGRTPLVELDVGVAPTVYAKVEWCNLHDQPHGGGSIKSRIVPRMLDRAERRGDLPGQTVVEASSGNTASELARIGGARGYDVAVVVPADAARGKRDAVRDAGGRIVTVPAGSDYAAKFDRLADFRESTAAATLWIDQYDNPANPAAHREATGPELWRQSAGTLTHFVAGAGSGGTVSGAGRALHERGDVTVVGVEPAEAPHGIEGLRHFRGEAHAHRDVYDGAVLDARRYVDTETAWQAARDLRERYVDRRIDVVDAGQYDRSLVREVLRVDDDFLVGPSSGAAVAAVRRLAGEGSLDADDVVGVLLCDRGDKYPESLWVDVV